MSDDERPAFEPEDDVDDVDDVDDTPGWLDKIITSLRGLRTRSSLLGTDRDEQPDDSDDGTGADERRDKDGGPPR